LSLSRAKETEECFALGGIALGEEESVGGVGIDSLNLIACHCGHHDWHTMSVGGAESLTRIIDVVWTDYEMACVSASLWEAEGIKCLLQIVGGHLLIVEA